MGIFKSFVLYVSISFLFGVLIYALSENKDALSENKEAPFVLAAIWAIGTSAALFSVVLPLYLGFTCYIISCLVISLLAVIAIGLTVETLKPDTFQVSFVVFCLFSPFLAFFHYLFARSNIDIFNDMLYLGAIGIECLMFWPDVVLVNLMKGAFGRVNSI